MLLGSTLGTLGSDPMKYKLRAYKPQVIKLEIKKSRSLISNPI